jgi:hypothetical protein
MSNIFENSIESPKEQIDKKFLDFLQEELMVAIPATVVNTDLYETQQVVDVIPCIDDILIDGRELKAPIIKSVFVKLPSGGGFNIKLPIAGGDKVTLHYSHKDISRFLDGDGSNIAQSTSRIAQRRDCWVTHGFGTRSSNQAPSASDYVTEGPNTTITITPAGEVTLTTNSDITVNTSGEANVSATAGCNITADTTITGTVNIDGDVTVAAGHTLTSPNGNFSSSLIIDSKELKNHNHDYADWADYNNDGTATATNRTTLGNN